MLGRTAVPRPREWVCMFFGREPVQYVVSYTVLVRLLPLSLTHNPLRPTLDFQCACCHLVFDSRAFPLLRSHVRVHGTKLVPHDSCFSRSKSKCKSCWSAIRYQACPLVWVVQQHHHHDHYHRHLSGIFACSPGLGFGLSLLHIGEGLLL